MDNRQTKAEKLAETFEATDRTPENLNRFNFKVFFAGVAKTEGDDSNGTITFKDGSKAVYRNIDNYRTATFKAIKGE